MAWVRQLPSGLWAATVRTPNGRITESHPLKTVIDNWAKALEVDIDRGDFIDPRLGEVTVGEFWERTRNSRHLEKASRKRDESHWRNHVSPKWANIKMGTVLKPDVSSWVVEMETAHRDDCTGRKRCPGCKVGAATVEGAVGVLIALFDMAIDAKILRHNPARGVKKRPRDAHVDRVLDADEEQQLLERLDERLPGRVDARLFCELMLETGMRWEEVAAIPPEMVDAKRHRIHIAWVMERDGTARPYAKSEAGNRTVAYGDALAARMSEAKLGARSTDGVFPKDGPTRLVFFSPGGGGRTKRKHGDVGPLLYSGWYARVWRPALLAPYDGPPPERPAGKSGPLAVPKGQPYLDDPQPTPHDLRHTFGTRLADEGVPIHDIMALMGHKDIRSAQRYLHSSEERFTRARQALNRVRGVAEKPQDHESSVSHEPATR